MVNQLLNHMMQAFNRSQMNVGYAHLGIITSVDAVNYSVKVLLQPEEIETGFIPYCTPVYGWVAPPSGGEQCLVLFERGNNNVPIGALLLYWDQSRAPGVSSPGDTAPGEMLVKHSSGAHVKLTNEGKVLINSQLEIDATAPVYKITSTTSITLDAPNTFVTNNLIVGGNIEANNGAITMNNGAITTNADIITTQDIQASGVSLKTHLHSGVTTGGSNTGAPV
jgi:phage baseplate assembly protein V